MLLFVFLGAVLGSLMTWAITKFYYDQRRRLYLREAISQSERSLEIQDQFYATHAMLYLSALRALEAGDAETAKCELASGAAGFYFQFSSPAQSRWIEDQKREVEILAETSQTLRETLKARRSASGT